MKKLSFLFIIFFFSFLTSISQNTPPIEEVKIIEVSEPEGLETIEVPFAIIEKVPVYDGCDENTSNEQLRMCMSNAIAKYIGKHFNTDVTKNIGLPSGPNRIITMFKIDKEGNIIDIKARAKHPNLEKEAIRVISLLPKLIKPGYQRGKPVIVPYSLPIIFNIVADTPSEQKEGQKN